MPKSRTALPLLALASALALATPAPLGAADVRVDKLELLTHGELNQTTGSFEVGSRLYYDMSLEGGDKFAGLLKLDFLNGDLENALSLASQSATSSNYLDKLDTLTSPRLRTVAVTARSLFELPLDLSYFVGQMDNFCSGDDFTPLFGTASFGTELRGPMVYPDGVGGNSSLWFDGIHAANGTGFRLGTNSKLFSNAAAYAYFYQDANVGSGVWSGDLRFLYNQSALKLEAFAGATAAGSYGLYRGGFLFLAAPGDIGEFLAQIGVTRWDAGSDFSLDNMYFLFEPRINIGSSQTAITVFYHPAWYLQRDFRSTGESGALDASCNIRFGQIAKTGNQGGLQTILAFRPLTTNSVTTPPLAVDTSPYYSMVAGGIQWDFKLDLRVFPWPSVWYGVFKPFIGLKTSF